MKAHIMRTDEFAEFNKTSTVIVTMAINATEARRILEEALDPDHDEHSSEATREMWRLLVAIEQGRREIEEYNRG